MRSTVLIVSAGLALSAGALAKPLNRAWTPPQAPWVVHVDLDAVMASKIGQLGFSGPEPILQEVADDIREDLGFDLFKEVRSVTVYGMTAEHENPVIIVSTTPEAEARLIAMAAAHGEAAVEENGRMIFEIEPDDDQGHFGTFMAGPGPNERLIIVSPSRDLLHSAVDVIEGKGKLAADLEQSPLSAPPRDGSIVYVSAADFGKELDIEVVSVLFQRAEGMRLDLGEVNGEMYVDVDVRAVDEQQAQQLHQMAQGGIAMSQFFTASHPELADVATLAQKIQLAVNGQDLSLRFRHDSATLLDHLRRLQELDDDDFEFDMDHDHDGHDGDHDHQIRVRERIKVGEDGKIEE